MKAEGTFNRLAEEKQKRIIEAALLEFSEKGYSKASINQIIKNAGIAKGSIFQYFGNKERLFAFIFAHSLERVKDSLRAIRDNSAGLNFFLRLEKIIEEGLDFSEKYPDIYKLYTHLLMEPNIPFRDIFLTRLRDDGKKFLLKILKEAKKNKEVKALLPDTALIFLLEAFLDRFLLSSVLPYLSSGLFEKDKARDYIPSFIDIFKKGMSAE